MGLAYLDYQGWAKIDWGKISNSTSAAVQNGLNQTIVIMNNTAIQVQQHATVAHSGVNEITLFPLVGAMGLMGGLIYGVQKG